MARSAAMRALLAELRRYAAADANVLITGGTGVGKDLVARTLHALSSRKRASRLSSSIVPACRRP